MTGRLQEAGFLAIEAEGDRLFARLPHSGAEVVAERQAEGWLLSVSRPLRARPAEISGWLAINPATAVDYWQGETRMRQAVADDTIALRAWAALAEDFVATSLRWRKGQRAGGEGF